MAKDKNPLGLDPKKLRLESVDKHFTTLRHKDGHQLRIAHNILSPESRKALQAFSKVENDTMTPVQAEEKQAQTPGKPMAQGGMPRGMTYAEGGNVASSSTQQKPQQDSKDLSEARAKMRDEQSAVSAYGTVPSAGELVNRLKNAWADGGQVPHNMPDNVTGYANGGETNKSDSRDNDESMSNDRRLGEAVGHAVRAAMSQPLPMPSGGPQPQSADAEVPDTDQTAASAPMPPQPQIPNAPVLQPGMPGYAAPAQPETPAQPAAAAPQAQPAASAPAATQPQAQMPANPSSATAMSPIDRQARDRHAAEQALAQDPKNVAKQQLVNENNAFEQDLVNGHITPKTYHDLFAKNADGSEKSTLGKIGTLFAMMVGGAGAGLAHQPNAIMEMMNNTIKNDLDAQMKSKDNAQNFLRLNQAHLMNTANIKNMNVETATKAYALTQSQMLQSTFHDLATNVNKLSDTDPLKIRSKMALAALYPQMQAKINNLNDLAVGAQEFYNTFTAPQGNNSAGNEQNFQKQVAQLRVAGPEGEKLAEFKIDRHIPGINGEASRPIPEEKRGLIQAQNILDDKGRQVLNYVKAHRGTWKPAEIAKGEQMVDEMKNFYNSSIEGGALTEGRLDWYDRQFGTGKKDGVGRWIGGSHPTDTFSQLMGSTARMQEMVDSNTRRRDLELKGLGFPTTQQASPQAPQKAPQPEQLSKSGRPMIQKNGKWFYK